MSARHILLPYDYDFGATISNEAKMRLEISNLRLEE